MNKIPGLIALAFLYCGTAAAADREAGKAKVEAVCSSCHGITGVSASPSFPNLAGQKEGYLRIALTAYQSGTRKDPVMGNIAANLTAADIDNLASYLSGLPCCP